MASYAQALIELDDARYNYDVMSTLREAVKRQIPRRPKLLVDGYFCSACGGQVMRAEDFCVSCGQAIDWSDS